jgi:hypothetical protein
LWERDDGLKLIVKRIEEYIVIKIVAETHFDDDGK